MLAGTRESGCLTMREWLRSKTTKANPSLLMLTGQSSEKDDFVYFPRIISGTYNYIL